MILDLALRICRQILCDFVCYVILCILDLKILFCHRIMSMLDFPLRYISASGWALDVIMIALQTIMGDGQPALFPLMI